MRDSSRRAVGVVRLDKERLDQDLEGLVLQVDGKGPGLLGNRRDHGPRARRVVRAVHLVEPLPVKADQRRREAQHGGQEAGVAVRAMRLDAFEIQRPRRFKVAALHPDLGEALQ
jgi:hypothetical protein